MADSAAKRADRKRQLDQHILKLSTETAAIGPSLPTGEQIAVQWLQVISMQLTHLTDVIQSRSGEDRATGS